MAILNDFNYCKDGFENYVDKFLGVCQMHVDHLINLLPHTKEKWGY